MGSARQTRGMPLQKSLTQRDQQPHMVAAVVYVGKTLRHRGHGSDPATPNQEPAPPAAENRVRDPAAAPAPALARRPGRQTTQRGDDPGPECPRTPPGLRGGYGVTRGCPCDASDGSRPDRATRRQRGRPHAAHRPCGRARPVCDTRGSSSTGGAPACQAGGWGSESPLSLTRRRAATRLGVTPCTTNSLSPPCRANIAAGRSSGRARLHSHRVAASPGSSSPWQSARFPSWR